MVFLSYISVCPLNFNKLARIKSVHQVFIFKNISHLVTDYTGSANHSADIGMRMPVNPGINPAVSYQFSIFTGKCAVQHGTPMMLSRYLKCRQVMRNHHDMGCRNLLDTFLNKVNTGLVHPVEFLHLQQLPIELNLSEIIHAFPHEILIVRIDP